MEAKKKPVETVSLSDLDARPSPGQEVVSITDAPEREAGRKIQDEGEAFAEIVALLEQKKVI